MYDIELYLNRINLEQSLACSNKGLPNITVLALKPYIFSHNNTIFGYLVSYFLEHRVDHSVDTVGYHSDHVTCTLYAYHMDTWHHMMTHHYNPQHCGSANNI